MSVRVSNASRGYFEEDGTDGVTQEAEAWDVAEPSICQDDFRPGCRLSYPPTLT